ncbi:MAG: transketolase [Terracidiphilus sp.]|nr:transketolase [Terracidiphilus sp.]
MKLENGENMSTCTAGASGEIYHRGIRHSEEMIRELSHRAYEYRAHVLRMVYERKSGHIGGAFSVAEILTALYFHQLRLDPENPEWKDRDRLVFSKGHACAMLYTVLAHRGYFPIEELGTFRGLNSRLQGHPEPAKTPGVEVAAGPLGHGVAIGAGMALAARLESSRRNIYVVLGDGELNSGVIWEGVMLGAKFGLDRLKVIVDCNGVQQTGSTSQVMPTEPIADKWAAFNWHVIEIHGHSMAEILDALDYADEIHGRPVVIIARTTKGKGVSFMENAPQWHGGIPSVAQFESALAELQDGAKQWQG